MSLSVAWSTLAPRAVAEARADRARAHREQAEAEPPQSSRAARPVEFTLAGHERVGGGASVQCSIELRASGMRSLDAPNWSQA